MSVPRPPCWWRWSAPAVRPGHDLSLGLVALRVEDLVLDFPNVQHPLSSCDLHRRGAHDRAAGIRSLTTSSMTALNSPAGLEDQIVLVLPRTRVGGMDITSNVDVPQLLGFRLGRSGHAGQLVVHPEVVLKRDGGVGPVAASMRTPSFASMAWWSPSGSGGLPDPAGLLVDALDLVHDHVVHVLLEQGVGLES